MLGDGGENMDGEPVGFGEISGNEIDAAFQNVGNERHASGEAIQLGDDKRGAVKATEGEGFCQFRPIGIAPALDLHLFSDQRMGPLGQEVVNRFPLSV